MKTIAVVEDNADNRLLLRALLDERFHIVEFETGADAIAGLPHAGAELVLLDISLPGMDGVELFHEIERRFPTLSKRIIFVTGDVLDVEKRRFLESSGAPFLMKPVDLGEVRRVVRRALVS